MSTDFPMDLRVARKKAGYTQRDVAHLLSVQQSHLSALEHGKIMPSIKEVITLSLIYGRSFESLFSQIMSEARTTLRTRLTTMPKTVRDYAATQNRSYSIDSLQSRLSPNTTNDGGA